MEDLLQVGVITSTHGIRGEVKVFPTTDDPNRFRKLKQVILDTGKEQLDMEIASVKFFKNQVIVKFKGIDDINDVEKYRKAGIYVTRENAVPLGENEYFIADLIGMDVFEEDGETVRNARQIIDPDDPTVTWFLYDLSMGYGAVARGIAEEYEQDYSDFYFNSTQAYLNAGVIFLDTIPDLRQGDVILPTNTEGQNTLAKLKTLAQKTKVN